MKLQQIKRLQRFIFTVIIGIIIVNVLTSVPSNTPKNSDTIKGVWLTHIGRMIWIKENLFDELVVQIYRSDSKEVTESLLTSGIQEASNYVQVAVGIYAGGNKQLKSLSEIEKQVKAVEKLGYGYSIFCWEHTSILLRKIIYLFRQISLLFATSSHAYVCST